MIYSAYSWLNSWYSSSPAPLDLESETKEKKLAEKTPRDSGFNESLLEEMRNQFFNERQTPPHSFVASVFDALKNSQASFSDAIKYAELICLRWNTPHSMRHDCLTILLERAISLEEEILLPDLLVLIEIFQHCKELDESRSCLENEKKRIDSLSHAFINEISLSCVTYEGLVKIRQAFDLCKSQASDSLKKTLNEQSFNLFACYSERYPLSLSLDQALAVWRWMAEDCSGQSLLESHPSSLNFFREGILSSICQKLYKCEEACKGAVVSLSLNQSLIAIFSMDASWEENYLNYLIQGIKTPAGHPKRLAFCLQLFTDWLLLIKASDKIDACDFRLAILKEIIDSDWTLKDKRAFFMKACLQSVQDSICGEPVDDRFVIRQYDEETAKEIVSRQLREDWQKGFNFILELNETCSLSEQLKIDLLGLLVANFIFFPYPTYSTLIKTLTLIEEWKPQSASYSQKPLAQTIELLKNTIEKIMVVSFEFNEALLFFEKTPRKKISVEQLARHYTRHLDELVNSVSIKWAIELPNEHERTKTWIRSLAFEARRMKTLIQTKQFVDRTLNQTASHLAAIKESRQSLRWWILHKKSLEGYDIDLLKVVDVLYATLPKNDQAEVEVVIRESFINI